jgi:hypothetical protein
MSGDAESRPLNERRHAIVSRASRLQVGQQTQMYKLMRDCGTAFNLNANGAFCNLLHVESGVLDKVDEFIKMCLDEMRRGADRDAQLEQYEKELEQAPVACAGPVVSAAQITRHEILKDLTALERSVAKETMTSMVVRCEDAVVRKSPLPKFSGIQAKLFKSCRAIGRVGPGSASAASRRKVQALRKPSADGDEASDGEADEAEADEPEDDDAPAEDGEEAEDDDAPAEDGEEADEAEADDEDNVIDL